MPNYLPSKNYIGSSGYGIGPSGRYGPLTVSPDQTTPEEPDYGVFDPASQKVVSLKTGKPWSGKEPRSGQVYQNGSLVQGDTSTGTSPSGVNPKDPNSRYSAVDVTKDPVVAGDTSDLLKTFKEQADKSLQGFNDHLADFQKNLNQAQQKANDATNIQPTVDALKQAQSTYSADLGTSTEAYRKALADAATNQRAVVQHANDVLPMYDQAARNVADRQAAIVGQQFSKYKLGSGVPTAGGSDEARILARAAADVYAPMEQAKIGQRYNIINGLEMPTEASIGAQNINFAGSFLPSVAGSRYSSATNLAGTIQSLKQATAGMSYDNAMRFLQAQGIPPQMVSQILSGQAANLGQLASLNDASHYRGLQDNLGMDLSQPVYYSQALPAYPNLSPSMPNPRYPGAGNGPVEVGPAPLGHGIPYRPLGSNPQAAPVDYNSAYQAYSNQMATTGQIPLDFQDWYASVNRDYRRPNTGSGTGYTMDSDGNVTYLGAWSRYNQPGANVYDMSQWNDMPVADNTTV